MQLKSYFSGTVEAAMALARKELREEDLEKVAHNGLAGRGHFAQVSHSFDAAPVGLCARLVNARPAAPEAGAYEAVFGVVNSPLTPEVLKSPKPSEALNGRARELASTPAPLNPLLKSLLLKQRAAA